MFDRSLRISCSAVVIPDGKAKRRRIVNPVTVIFYSAGVCHKCEISLSPIVQPAKPHFGRDG